LLRIRQRAQVEADIAFRPIKRQALDWPARADDDVVAARMLQASRCDAADAAEADNGNRGTGGFGMRGVHGDIDAIMSVSVTVSKLAQGAPYVDQGVCARNSFFGCTPST
jgi:hypothetical protein